MPILTDQERIGTTIGDGKYTLERVLGRGGMGTVFEALHAWTGRRVAVKLLRHDMASDFDASRRFLQEARAATAIEHPNVVEVFDMGRHDESTVYMVFELLRGESLADRIETMGRLDPMEAVMILLPVADALAAAHRLGIVHRDVKPDNIFLEDDGMGYVRPKLLDFGIARVSERKSGETRTGVVAGTPEYLSPEHAQGFRAGPASDVWSLGVVLFECITGYRPFESESVVGVLMAIVSHPIPSLRECAYVPEPIADLVERTLVRDPAARFPDGAAFRDALALASQVEFIPSRSRSVPPKILHDSGEISLSGAHRVELRQSSPSLASTPPIRLPTPIPARPSTPSSRPLPLGVAVPDESLDVASRASLPPSAGDAHATLDSVPPIATRAPTSMPPPVVALEAVVPDTDDDAAVLASVSLTPPAPGRSQSPARFALPAFVLLFIVVAIGYRATRPEGLTAGRDAGRSVAATARAPGAVQVGASSGSDAPGAPSALAVPARDSALVPDTNTPARPSSEPARTAILRPATAESGSRERSSGSAVGAPARATLPPPDRDAPRAERPTARTRGSQNGTRTTIQRGANGSLILD